MTDDLKSSTTSESAPSPPMPITRQDVEKLARDIFSPASMLASDSAWNSLQEFASLGVTLCPIRHLIQPLARKYHQDEKAFLRRALPLIEARSQCEVQVQRLTMQYQDQPKTLEEKIKRLVERHAKKIRVVLDKGPALGERIPGRALRPFGGILPIIGRLLAGDSGEYNPEVARLLSELLRAFAAQPGRKRIEKYDEALKLYVNGVKNFHQICLKLEPGYASMSDADKHFARDRMHSAITRRLEKGAAPR